LYYSENKQKTFPKTFAVIVSDKKDYLEVSSEIKIIFR
jgi:hypothetical protein